MVKNEDLKADIEDLEEGLKKQLNTNSRMREELEIQNQKLRARISELEKDLAIQEGASTKDDETDTLNQLIQAQQDRIKELEQQIQDQNEPTKEEKLDRLSHENNRLHHENQTLQTSMRKLEEQLSKLEDSIAIGGTGEGQGDVVDRVKELESKIKTLVNKETTRILDMKAENDQLRADLEHANHTIKELQNQTTRRASDNDQDQGDQLNSEIDQLHQTIKQLERELETVEREKISLEVKLQNIGFSSSPVQPEKKQKPKETKPEPTAAKGFDRQELEEMLISDKLVETVYIRIKALKSVTLKILAMQSGVSVENCKIAVDRLEAINAITFDKETRHVTLNQPHDPADEPKK